MKSILRTSLASLGLLSLSACGTLEAEQAAEDGALDAQSHWRECNPLPRRGAQLVRGRELLIAIEDGGAVTVDPARGTVQRRYATGPNAFGAIYSADGRRAFVTDKNAGTLSELDRGSDRVLGAVTVGTTPQQPGLTADGRMYIPLSGEAGIAVVDLGGARGAARLSRKLATGTGTKPHIVSVSPDGRRLWATIQGQDPRVLSVDLSSGGEGAVTDYRYDLVPRVVAATNSGAFFTGHHSTGLHRADAMAGTVATPYMDVFGNASEARKQIEGVAATADGGLVSLTHEGRKALVALKFDGTRVTVVRDVANLSAPPYWTTLDPSGLVAYVSIPGSGSVEAHDLTTCRRAPLWTATVGGKPKRMAVTSVAN